jgi:lipoate-protein ligase A
MAKDRELLERAERGGSYARVYTWDGPWVSLGRFQRPEKALRDYSAINWTMRPTGGKAVLHGHDITVTIAANLHELGIPQDANRRVSTVYRAIVLPLVEAMCKAGFRCELAERTDFVKNAGHTADCFAHVSPNDIVDPRTGEKVCGCALRVTESAVLLQSSIPIGIPLVDPSRVFDNPHVPARIRDLNPEALVQALRTISLSRDVEPVV